MEFTFQGLGWKIRLQKQRYSFFFTLAKEIILGNGLKTGDELFYYLMKVDGRNAVLLFLDGGEKEVVCVKNNAKTRVTDLSVLPLREEYA